MANEHEGQGKKFVGLYEGPVVDNKDPKKLGRVRVSIPGIADPTGWAFPLGWAGAGGKKRGGWHPPPIGAEVGVMFKMGDPDHPRYLPGFPGEGEAPEEVDEATVDEAADDLPFIFNGRRYKIIVDERAGKTRCALEDKKTGDLVELDGVNGGLALKATAALSIEVGGAFSVKASSVEVNGRKMSNNGKPW